MTWYDAIVIGVGLVGALADLVVEPTGARTATLCKECRAIPTWRRSRTGRLRPDRRTGHACDRRPRSFDRQRGAGGRHVHGGLCRDREEGRIAQELPAEMARQGGVRLCGPNCLGLFNLRTGHTPLAPISRRGRNGRGRSAWWPNPAPSGAPAGARQA